MMVASTIPTALHAVSSSLNFLVPLFALILLVLTLSHPLTRVQNDSQRRKGGRQRLNAYLAIWSLAILSTLAGAVGLKSALGTPKGVGMEMRGRGEACVEALIFLEVGISVLYLAQEHIVHRRKSYWIATLVTELVVAVIVSFAYSPLAHGNSFSFLPPILSLLFLATVIPILVLALRVHMAKQDPNNAQISLPEIRTPSFAGTNISASDSLPSTSSQHQEKIPSPKFSISELTAVNHYQPARSPHVDANTLESGASGAAGDVLDRSIASSRSSSLLAILIACQAAAFVAFSLEITAVKVGLSETLNSEPSRAADASADTYAILQIVRVALMVLCITGIMSAFMLRAYNAYLHTTPIGGQVTADPRVLSPTLTLSRMNTFTVSISTTAAPPLSSTKVRTANTPAVFSAAITNGTCGSKDAFGRKGVPGVALTRHSSTASYSSSFACPMAKSIPIDSMLLGAETIVDKQAPRSTLRDSKFDDDEDGEPGYAYIYTDGQSSCEQPNSGSLTDPLNVGEPVPFRPRQHLLTRSRPSSRLDPTSSSKPISLHHSHSDSIFTNHGMENILTPVTPSSPLPSPPQAPIDIPTAKFSNPYPTPRSTPTATAFADRTSSSSDDPCSSPSTDFMVRPPLSRASTTSSKMAKSVTTCSSLDDHYPSPSERPIACASRTSYCSSSSTHIPARTSSSPTPTPTRAPTPGLMFTPFLGSHVRKRDSLRVKTTPPSPPSQFLKLKEKAKKITSKHDSISESLAQSFEGIRNGLSGSNGKTKYPLRSSTSNNSLGLGLGMPSGFKFPHLTRRPSELGKEQKNASSSTLEEMHEEVKATTMAREPEPVSPPREEQRMEVEEEPDFMDLRDPFASPTALNGGSIRIMSSAELSIRTGRESRTGYRDDDIFELDGAYPSRSASCGKAKGMRMSAWGRLPMSPPSCSSSPSLSPLTPMHVQYQPQTPTPSPARSKSKKRSMRSMRSSKEGRGRSSGEGTSLAAGSGQGGRAVGAFDEEEEFVCEEALIAQELLRKLDEKLWAAS